MAEEMGLNLQLVKGTGPAGRINKKDIEAYAQEKSSQAASKVMPPLQPKPGNLIL
jgi:pyruvate/2-oxoglutarate dehydrogenase complex dihydrolipoamide acyltransferase (E2) component